MQRHKPTIQTVPISEVPRTQRHKVLVVDDDPLIAKTTATVLGVAGYECRVVHGGAAAIKAASEFVPDLVLSDVMMPDVNGVQACMRIREQLLCSILLFSADVWHARLLMEQAQANFPVIAKPIAAADLCRQIELLLSYRVGQLRAIDSPRQGCRRSA